MLWNHTNRDDSLKMWLNKLQDFMWYWRRSVNNIPSNYSIISSENITTIVFLVLLRTSIPSCSTSRPTIINDLRIYNETLYASSEARASRAKNSVNSYLSRRHSGTVLTTKDVNLFAFIKRRGRVAFQRMRHERATLSTRWNDLCSHVSLIARVPIATIMNRG